MVFSFDADAEGFPELDMWVSSILRQGIDLNVADPQEIAKALEEEFEAVGGGGMTVSVVQGAEDVGVQDQPYNYQDLHTTYAPETAELFASLLRSHMPVPALQDEVALFADGIARNGEVGVYYVGADSWSLSVATLAACSVSAGVKFAHLDMGQRPHYASYTKGLPSLMLSSCPFVDLDLCLYDWDATGTKHPVPCCHAAVFKAWPLCESPLWTVDRLQNWIEDGVGKSKRVKFQTCPYKEVRRSEGMLKQSDGGTPPTTITKAGAKRQQMRHES